MDDFFVLGNVEQIQVSSDPQRDERWQAKGPMKIPKRDEITK